MAKARDIVRMSEQEIADFLSGAHSLQVATLDKEGAPHLTTVWFAMHDGAILFETYGKSQKILNLRRDPRVAVLAEDGKSYDELRGVSIQGRADIVETGPELTELMGVLIAHHFPELSPEQHADMAGRMARKRIVVVVRPEKVMSWDHRKLGGVGP